MPKCRWIGICQANGDGPFSIVFPDEGVPDDDYLKQGAALEMVHTEGMMEIDFDDTKHNPFQQGRVYRED
ncbi:MAG: hypothetical protein ACYC63_07815 [Armatimonadota bacterium]